MPIHLPPETLQEIASRIYSLNERAAKEYRRIRDEREALLGGDVDGKEGRKDAGVETGEHLVLFRVALSLY